MNAFLRRLLHPQIPRIAAVLLITLVWSSLAFCGEIHDAVEKGDLAKAKALLKNNPELVSSKNNAGFNPLYYAARDGYKDIAELLLAKSAYVNAMDASGRTPLHYAAEQESRDVVEVLLAKGADINARIRGTDITPVRTAERTVNLDIAELLRRHGGHE